MKLLHLLLARFGDAALVEQLRATRADNEAMKRTLMSVDRSVEREMQRLLRRNTVLDDENQRLRERLCAASEGETE